MISSRRSGVQSRLGESSFMPCLHGKSSRTLVLCHHSTRLRQGQGIGVRGSERGEIGAA